MASEEFIDIEIAYALPERQRIMSLKVAMDSTARQVLLESGIDRVSRAKGEYGKTNPKGYNLASRHSAYPFAPLDEVGEEFQLAADKPPALREYVAFGDNTGNSLDSRYWGEVHGFNLVGPAWISLWPFGSGHWGFID